MSLTGSAVKRAFLINSSLCQREPLSQVARGPKNQGRSVVLRLCLTPPVGKFAINIDVALSVRKHVLAPI